MVDIPGIPIRLSERTETRDRGLEVVFERQPIGDEKYNLTTYNVALRLKGDHAEPFRATMLGSLFVLGFEAVMVGTLAPPTAASELAETQPSEPPVEVPPPAPAPEETPLAASENRVVPFHAIDDNRGTDH